MYKINFIYLFFFPFSTSLCFFLLLLRGACFQPGATFGLPSLDLQVAALNSFFFFLPLILAAVVAVSVCVGNCALRAHVISAISRSLIAKLTYEVYAFVAWPRRKC